MKIPFTREQFFEIFEKYNLGVFPVQLIILMLGISSAILLVSKFRLRHKLIGGFLGALWLWTGIAYHYAFFTEINKAASLFALLFLVQGLIFLVETFFGNKLEFEFNGKLIDYIASFFIVYGIVIYPVLVYLLDSPHVRIITLGLPCPSAIFTFGFLILTKPKFSKYILIIPVVWASIGTSAAYYFGVYPDYFMALSALIGIAYLLRRNKENNEN